MPKKKKQQQKTLELQLQSHNLRSNSKQLKWLGKLEIHWEIPSWAPSLKKSYKRAQKEIQAYKKKALKQLKIINK